MSDDTVCELESERERVRVSVCVCVCVCVCLSLKFWDYHIEATQFFYSNQPLIVMNLAERDFYKRFPISFFSVT